MTIMRYCHSEGAIATEESLRFFASLMMTFTHYCHSEEALATEESLRFFASLRMTKRVNAQNDFNTLL